MPENGEVSSVQLRPKGQNTVSVFNSVVHFLAPFAESQYIREKLWSMKVLEKSSGSLFTDPIHGENHKTSWNEIVAYQSKMRKQSQMPHNFTKFTIFFYCLKLKTVALNEHYVSKGNFLTNSFPLLSGI